MMSQIGHAQGAEPNELTPQEFRDVIGRFASGVTVITTNVDDHDFGSTASAVSSLSAEPPMVLVCLNKSSSTAAAIMKTGTFAVNVLAEDHAELAGRFASKLPDKFEGVPLEYDANGSPLLVGAIAHLVCRVSEQVEAGTHFVFLSFVDEAFAYAGHPLAYFRGSFGRMQTGPDAAVLRSVRDYLISIVSDRDEAIETEALAERLGVEAGLVHHALTALVSESLVRREAGKFVLEPVPDEVLYDYYAAKLAVEIGVAEQSVGKISEEQLATLRSFMEKTLQYVEDEHFTDPEGYIAANEAFHDYMVGLAGSSIVLDIYRRLGLPGLERRTITASTYVNDELLNDHRALVAGYEAADLEAVLAVLRGHAGRPREMRTIENSRLKG